MQSQATAPQPTQPLSEREASLAHESSEIHNYNNNQNDQYACSPWSNKNNYDGISL